MAELKHADLRNVDLRGASLRGISLRRADLRGANLDSADLHRARLQASLLGGASLVKANLYWANLTWTDLTSADLSDASLRFANLDGANTLGTTFAKADLGFALLARLRSPSRSLLDVDKLQGASIDWATIAEMLHMGHEHVVRFLTGSGMAPVVATYLVDSLRSLDEAGLFSVMQSVFISYGQPDAAFAERLRNALLANGVRTWFYPRDAVAGEVHYSHLHRQIHAHDRAIVCCSRASLTRNGALHELTTLLKREQREGGASIIIPVLLEGDVLDSSTPPPWWPAGFEVAFEELTGRVAIDLSDWERSESSWDEGIRRLLLGLRKPD